MCRDSNDRNLGDDRPTIPPRLMAASAREESLTLINNGREEEARISTDC